MKKVDSIMVVGDSLSKGVVYDDEKGRYRFSPRCFASLLEGVLRPAIYNKSKFGSTIDYGSAVLHDELPRLAPDYVLIEFGGNDCDFDWNAVAESPASDHRPKTELTYFTDTLGCCVESVRRIGKKPVLMTLPPLVAPRYFSKISGGDSEKGGNILKWLGDVGKIYWWHERYSAAVSLVARQAGAFLIDVRSRFLVSDDFSALICSDGIHPNENGHSVIARAIRDFIDRYGEAYDFYKALPVV